MKDRTAAKLLRSKRGGFFLDLAANEPVVLSNTRSLERDLGWKGVCIEANPFYWQGLAEVIMFLLFFLKKLKSL